MFKLKLSLPNLAEGGTVTIAGLGELQNGKEYIVKDDMPFREAHATVVAGEYSAEGRRDHVKVLGLPLDEAFANTEGIEVTRVQSGGDNE